MAHKRRNGDRHFNARKLGQKQELKTVTFLGQQFVVAAESGHGDNKRYNLVGMQGTQLEGIAIRGVSKEALRKYKDDESASSRFVRR